MVDKIDLTDANLEEIFQTRIIQFDNYNANSELFIQKDSIYKIYYGDSIHNDFNISVVQNIMNQISSFKDIPELVLPKALIFYHNTIVGFSMPYIQGVTLEEGIQKELYDEEEMKKIFIDLLKMMNHFQDLPFEFFIGDMHEKNILLDKNKKIHIIDCDSFIINNHKLCVEKEYLVGKYVNHFYSNSELEKIGISADYYSLLCIVLKYTFKDILKDTSEPVNWLRQDSQFQGLYPILDRVNEKFILSEEDIHTIFEFCKTFEYKYQENEELVKELKKIRNL